MDVTNQEHSLGWLYRCYCPEYGLSTANSCKLTASMNEKNGLNSNTFSDIRLNCTCSYCCMDMVDMRVCLCFLICMKKNHS